MAANSTTGSPTKIRLSSEPHWHSGSNNAASSGSNCAERATTAATSRMASSEASRRQLRSLVESLIELHQTDQCSSMHW